MLFCHDVIDVRERHFLGSGDAAQQIVVRFKLYGKPARYVVVLDRDGCQDRAHLNLFGNGDQQFYVLAILVQGRRKFRVASGSLKDDVFGFP